MAAAPRFTLREWPGTPSQGNVLRTASGSSLRAHHVQTVDERVVGSVHAILSRAALGLCGRPAAHGRYAYVVLVFAVVAVCGSFVGHSFSIAPYNEGIMEDLGISRTALSSLWAVTLVASAGWLNLVGACVDRYGSQVVVLLGGAVVMTSFTLFGRAQTREEVLLSLMMVRLSSVETVDFATRHCLNKWFVERRGFAAGVLCAVSSIGFILPACETLSVVAVGWRATAASIGGLCGALVVMSSVFLLSDPEDHGLPPDGGVSKAVCSRVFSGSDDDRADSFTFHEAVRAPIFWTLVLCWMMMCVPWAGINFLLASILKDQHYSQQDAVFVYLMLSICSAASAFLSGLVVDRIPHSKKKLSVAMVNGAMLLALLTGAVLERIPGILGPLLLGAFLGCWEGTGNVVSTVIIPDVFGHKHLGAIRGLFMASAQVSSGVGPLITAAAMDAGMSFSALCCVLAGCQAAGILLVCLVPAPVRRAGSEMAADLLRA